MGRGGIRLSSTGTVAPDDGGPATAVEGQSTPPSGPNGGGDADQQSPDRDQAAMLADVVFAVAVVATFVCYFVKSRYVVLNGDDWATVPRGNTFVDYFKPYQQNLSVVPIAVYHFVFTVFGFRTYWPLRFAGLASHVAIAVAIYLIVRSRWGGCGRARCDQRSWHLSPRRHRCSRLPPANREDGRREPWAVRGT